MKHKNRYASHGSKVLEFHRVFLNHELIQMIILHIKIQISENPGLYDNRTYHLSNFRKHPEVIDIFKEVDGYAKSNVQNSKCYNEPLEHFLLLPKLVFDLHELSNFSIVLPFRPDEPWVSTLTLT